MKPCKKAISASKNENIQVTGNPILVSPLDCRVRINHEPDGLLNGDIQS